MSVHHKNIIVTGAGRGIGAATAILLASRGADVAICARSEKELAAITTEIKTKFSSVKVFSKVVDLSIGSEAEKFYDEAEKALGTITGLVNNAAMLLTVAPENYTEKEIEEIFAVNVTTPALLSKEFFKRLKKLKLGGSLVNVGSLAGLQGFQKFSGLSLYSATKTALVGLTESLAVEGLSFGIRVNLVAPGATDTKMLREAMPDYNVKMKPENIARTVVFFLDDEESGLITGSIMAASD